MSYSSEDKNRNSNKNDNKSEKYISKFIVKQEKNINYKIVVVSMLKKIQYLKYNFGFFFNFNIFYIFYLFFDKKMV